MKILTTLKSKRMNWYNIWKWPAEIIDDIRQWSLVRKALKEPETISALGSWKYELRKDKIGRLYTVINVPEELWPYDKQDQVWPWMVEQLRELDMLLLQRQLSDLLYPEVTRIEDAPAYLVVLSPSIESFSFWKGLRWLFNLSLVAGSIYIINRIVIKFSGDSILTLLLSLI
jgi:hypothetical protein